MSLTPSDFVTPSYVITRKIKILSFSFDYRPRVESWLFIQDYTGSQPGKSWKIQLTKARHYSSTNSIQDLTS